MCLINIFFWVNSFDKMPIVVKVKHNQLASSICHFFQSCAKISQELIKKYRKISLKGGREVRIIRIRGNSSENSPFHLKCWNILRSSSVCVWLFRGMSDASMQGQGFPETFLDNLSLTKNKQLLLWWSCESYSWLWWTTFIELTNEHVNLVFIVLFDFQHDDQQQQ